MSSAGIVRKGHGSRKYTGWHCEEVSSFPTQVLQIQFGPLFRAEKLLVSYRTSGSHGDGQCSALVAAQPQGDAVRPLSWLTLCVSEPHSSILADPGQGHGNCTERWTLSQPEPSILSLLLQPNWSWLSAQNNTWVHNYRFKDNQK